jgi:hypothetical protein
VITAAELRAAFDPVAGTGRSSGAPPAADSVRYNYAPVFVPGITDPLSAAVFQLASGEERRGVDLRMQFEPRARIDGVVLGLDGAPTTARLSLVRRSPVQALNTGRVWPAAQNGTVSSGAVSPGPYALTAEVAAREGQPRLWASADVIATAGQVAHVTLRLQPTVAVTSVGSEPDGRHRRGRNVCNCRRGSGSALGRRFRSGGSVARSSRQRHMDA